MGFQMSLNKCATAHVVKGRLMRRGSTTLRSGARIEEVERRGSYWYLGIEQLMGVRLGVVKTRLGKQYLKRVRKTWESKLSAIGKVGLHNQWATSVRGG